MSTTDNKTEPTIGVFSTAYIEEARTFLSTMSETELDDAGPEYQRLFGYALALRGALRHFEGLSRDGKIYRWLQDNPDDCASAVADAYSQWHPGDPDPKPFDAILEGEVERLMRKRGAWGTV